MTVNRVIEQNATHYRLMEIKKIERRHEELRVEENHIKAQLRNNEQKRIEMNRYMNRAGQNVDLTA